MSTTARPLLYSFRRCPYAMRARLAIKLSGIDVDIQEVSLRNKPQEMLDLSRKGTVPVLVLTDGRVIDQSLDIMCWALAQHHQNDAALCLMPDGALPTEVQNLISQNDSTFKQALDRYKYAERFPEHSATTYRERAEVFLAILNSRLQQHQYLSGERLSMADLAILPFVRQCALVDADWFYSSRYKHLIAWLEGFLQSDLFIAVMAKVPVVSISDLL
ncbi:glutathione S-transferase [Undibacterium sp. RTI2.1]|uniref:glutathione S-transferase n=1 Tax=unclassified Undibacterium TaxID=2630295 RepID=UPI002AB3C30F|nr:MULTISPECIES: glutathione S-transferase [unclassified Undibacterium]MDY7538083.1 glutathione S-transferase [Undibacterium sp. 5I1]MEB0032479.1 glutathione S-transferase [Undibacterium sp. RTI2.1]MEB0118511.1 glutathione S-transferase [Undibacterium sp. RTI2.2]MEB0232249.1 glutathione S-transferase [Undibacterium sp. 10I3]MEB0259480.1 glutathione S-transferase [Undibacterium sp. 5I1]